MTKRLIKVINYSLKIMILSSLVFAFCGGANLITINQAKAGEPAASIWLDKAQEGGLNQVGQAWGGGEPRDIRLLVADFIKIILGFLGILAVVLIVYAGFKWMTSRGNEETIETSKKMLVAGVIGLVIIVTAYVLADFVISQIYVIFD